MKIIFHIGETIDCDTTVKKGTLNVDIQQVYIEYENNKIFLNDLKSVEFYKFNLGTMIKIQNADKTIYLSVPRIFINKGTGFVIINYFKTRKAKKLLDSAMKHQKLNKR